MTRLTQLNPTEDQEAEALAQWLRLKKLPFTHIANESGRGRTAMLRTAKLKRMGQSKGFPDYLIAIPSHIPYLEVIEDGENCIERRVDKRLIAIELKRQKGGHVSPSQRRWIKILNSAGIEAVVCRGFEEAEKFIKERLK